MTRGLETLWYKRHLLNPFRYRLFAVFLIGHKLLRWIVFLLIPPAVVGLSIVGFESVGGGILLATNLFIVGLGALGYYWPAERRVPRLLSLMGFMASAHLAGLLAWYRALRGDLDPIWEPTRRQ